MANERFTGEELSNLGRAFKGPRDVLAKKFLQVDDADWRPGAIQWSYGQRRERAAGFQVVFKLR